MIVGRVLRRIGVARLARSVALVSSLWLAGAHAACPGEAGEPIPRDRAALERLDTELAQAGAQCDTQPLFLAYRGAVLLALGRPADAATALELALLLNPDLPVAQIDYARALTQLGDRASAAAIWRSLLARSDVPTHLREEIRWRLLALDHVPADSTVWRHQGELGLRVGYDTNLNSATSAREITLTFPGINVTVPVADTVQPVEGPAAWVDGSWRGSRALAGDRELEVRATVRLRGAPTGSGVSYRQADLEATGHQRVEGGAWSLAIGADDVLYGGAHLLQSFRTSLVRTWVGNACGRRAGAEAEMRRYPSDTVLDGRYAGITAGLACRPYGDLGLGLVARAGLDDPVHTRAGGQQVLFDLRAQVTRTLFAPGVLQASLYWQGSRDRASYSPLLANGAPRSVQRTTLGLEWSRPIWPGWQGTVGMDAVRQSSNLRLFELQGLTVQTGLKRVW